ncbi:hypothetical protein B0H14DRAFT_2833903 [Mycena olivaceomarginata]|nr:hypothetical protein B0H14DRAFT_2833903 [Mycena olivaceomarginata]
MARCHGDGQKRPVYIYRFLSAGAIDEKIYQRQVTKLGLSNSLMGSSTSSSSSKSDSFSRKDLRDIFRIHPVTACNTQDLLECPCDGTVTANNGDNDDAIESDFEDGDSESEKKGFVNASEIQPGEINKMDKAYLEKKRDHILRKLLFVAKSGCTRRHRCNGFADGFRPSRGLGFLSA